MGLFQGAFYQGLDIGTRRDEPVLATAAGVVVRSGQSGDYGKSVEIAHRTGYRTIYGHLDAIVVKEGRHVRRGDRVGLAGSTGRDRAVNPLDFILDAK